MRDVEVVASFTVDLHGRITSWSRSASRFFGLEAPEALGRHSRELLPEERRCELAPALAAIRIGNAWTSPVPTPCTDGTRQITWRCEPLTPPGTERQAVVTILAPPPGLDPRATFGSGLGSTLDLDETARQVLSLAVPRLASAGGVYLLEPLLADGRPAGREASGQILVRRLVTTFTDTSAGDWLTVLPDDEVVVFAADTPFARCIIGASPVVFGQPDQETVARLSHRSGGDRLLSSYASFLAVPLTAAGQVAGMLLLANPASAPAFSQAEAIAAAELADAAGVCVANAGLFTQERRTALALQRGLLPRQAPAPAGLDIAHRYRPAGDRMVGGDWYDIVPLTDGRVTVTVGDTMGHGPEAAAIMAQLRAAAHVLADLELTPDVVLDRLNRMTEIITDGTFATCVCATLDPSTGACLIALAGHLPPVVALPDGTSQVISLPPGLPLGLAGTAFEVMAVTLPPGATLVMYTDGLVESRTRPFDLGITALRAELAAATGPLPTICDTIIDNLSQHGEDDTTLLLAHIPARANSHT